MSPPPTAIVFAKAPVMGAVKTRLARDVGAARATTLCRRLTARTLRRLAADARWRTVLAIAPDSARAARFSCWAMAPRRTRIAQGSGDIGVRMARALRRVGGPAVLVGSDIPELRADHVAAAFRALARADYVFGPAEDGGFWLVGARVPSALPRGFLIGPRWSSADALADAVATVPRGARVALAPRLADLDDGAAYAAFASARPARANIA